jgi:hypothetical protein
VYHFKLYFRRERTERSIFKCLFLKIQKNAIKREFKFSTPFSTPHMLRRNKFMANPLAAKAFTLKFAKGKVYLLF